MPHITKVLENEVGVQFDRVKDNTGSTGTAPINGMIIGQFKRGRTDKPMIITSANLKATLGYDPDNPDFVAVQDALKTNIPYISVMRVVSGTNETIEGCEGATNSATISVATNDSYDLKINGEIFHSGFIPIGEEDSELNLAPNQPFTIIVHPRDPMVEPILKREISFINFLKPFMQIELSLSPGIEHVQHGYFTPIDQPNKSIQYLYYSDFAMGYSQINFCLNLIPNA